MSVIDNKTILLIGGTGSFGKQFTQHVLNTHNPESLRIYSRSEYLQWKMQNKYADDRIRYLIGDVRDTERLNRAMNGVDIVIHAAAMKQVPACEYNPIEAVKTNIDGASNIIDNAIDNDVFRVLALSTDKAVHPVNLYGATKMVSEKLFTQGNAYAGPHKTKFASVRYGNVVGSRGSVIPVFLKQKETGTITITDTRMTRFWITLDQGVRFVINSLETMKGGEVFIPKIPSMKITDLAKVLAPDAKINITGIRPGEKLHEVLMTKDEARHSFDMGNYYIILPESPSWNISKPEGKPVASDFDYSSDNNSEWLDADGLKKMMQSYVHEE